MKRATVLLLTLFALVASEDKCGPRSSSCHECIRERGCSWHLGDDHEAGRSRCLDNPQLYQPENVFAPENVVEIVENSQTADVSPQYVKLKLRRLTEVNINFTNANPDGGIIPPHFQDIRIQLTRVEPTKTIVTVEVTRCPKDPSEFHQTIHLYLNRTKQNITLDIEMLCTCPCEEAAQSSPKDPRCGSSGTYKCGVCE